MKTITEVWKAMSADDKQALNELGEEENNRRTANKEPPLSKFELLRAVTPDKDWE